MNSPRRRHARPIESATLTVTFRADRETAARIREAFPSAVVRGRVCEVRVEAEHPGEVAEKAKAMLEKIRGVV